jgi:hypothetical protein
MTLTGGLCSKRDAIGGQAPTTDTRPDAGRDPQGYCRPCHSYIEGEPEDVAHR